MVSNHENRCVLQRDALFRKLAKSCHGGVDQEERVIPFAGQRGGTSMVGAIGIGELHTTDFRSP